VVSFKPWVGPITGLDDLEGRKSCHYQDSESDPLAFQPIASCYTHYAPHNTFVIFRIFHFTTNKVIALYM
jgi:hypothetical protein